MTLVELLVAVLITAVISVVLVRISIDSTRSLTSQLDEAGQAASVVNLYRQLRTDIAGASNVYVSSATAPASRATLCSTWDGTAGQWNPTTANSAFVRTLATIFGPVVNISSSNPLPSNAYDITSTTAPTFLTTSNGWVGYELRRAAASGSSYELWRVTCADSNFTPQTPTAGTARRLMTLGTALWSQSVGSPATTEYFAGTNAFRCDSADCTADASTSSVVRYYFTLRYKDAGSSTTSNRASLKLVTDSANNLAKQAMSRKLDR